MEMPLAAMLGTLALVVHGGVPRPDNKDKLPSLSRLQRVERNTLETLVRRPVGADRNDFAIAQDLLWYHQLLLLLGFTSDRVNSGQILSLSTTSDFTRPR